MPLKGTSSKQYNPSFQRRYSYEGGWFSCSVRHNWQKLILLKAGNHLVVTAWVDVYDTLHQCCFELFAAFVCADVKAGSDHSYFVHFRMYIER